MAKAGRPSEYNDDVVYRVLELIADGKSLKSICLSEDMPDKATWYRWMDAHKELRDKYARAKDDSADALADDIQDIADKVLKGIYDPQAARVAGDLKKWSASKLKPKKYGDKLDVVSDGEKLSGQIVGYVIPGVMDNGRNDKV